MARDEKTGTRVIVTELRIPPRDDFAETNFNALRQVSSTKSENPPSIFDVERIILDYLAWCTNGILRFVLNSQILIILSHTLHYSQPSENSYLIL